LGQKAAIALEWSEQAELNPEPEKNKGRGRPKGTLTEAAKAIGINKQRVFEVRQIRDANPALYRKVRAGGRSLNSALAEISTAQGRLIVQPVGRRGVHKPANKETSSAIGKPPPSRRATEKALIRIKEILGSWFYGEVKGRNLIQKNEEVVQFAKLTDAQMREVGSLLKRGWTFSVAFQEVVERLTPDDKIRALHTRAVANGGHCYLSSVGSFTHIVAWGPEKDRILAKLKDALAG
jgi:hypothetical protein